MTTLLQAAPAVPAAPAAAAPATSAWAAGTACFHCGLPVADPRRWRVDIDAVSQPMCCPGCAAVATAIVANGLHDYYRRRDAFAPNAAPGTLVPAALQLYDAPEIIAGFAEIAADDPALREATLSVEGIRCGACVWMIERRLAAVPGLVSARLNVSTEKLHVRWHAGQCQPSAIFGALQQLGYAAWPFDPVRHGEQLRRQARTLFRQLFVAGLCMMQVMMYALPAYVSADGAIEPDMLNLMRWASLLLTLPVVGYAARPFFQGAWADLRRGVPGMDVPVALGIAAAFTGSVVATMQQQGPVYFDSVTMFVFLLLGGRALELRVRRRAASTLEGLQHALPAAAWQLSGFPADRSALLVPAAQLRTGDYLLVKPGEALAADCIIVEGSTDIDAALLTGESRARHQHCGDALPGGALNIAQAIVVQVTRPVRDSTLAALIRLIDRAAQAKPRLALWADRAGAWFVGALLLLSLAVFAFWHWYEPARAWPIAIALLVVSCPCALSLATPSALAAATDRLVRQGVLVIQPHVLETLHRCTHVVFDKTGTLSAGRPQLQQVDLLEGANADAATCLQVAAALEAGSAHPLAAAIVRAAGAGADAAPIDTGRQLMATDVRQHAGGGVEGHVDGRRYRLGSAAFVGEISDTSKLSGLGKISGIAGIGSISAVSLPTGPGQTPVYLGSEGRWLAHLGLVDPLRPDAAAVVDYFQSIGKQVVLLSGDAAEIVAGVAQELGIDAAHGMQLPDMKLAFVQQLQQQGRVVAMIGDGINDAAVLQAADVSFAMAAGAPLAQAHADVVLLADRLGLVVDAARAARQTMAVIRQNLVWAGLYNAVAIPAAAFGYLNPWISGIGMSLSSAVVVLNALRLRRLPRASRSFIPSTAEI